MLVLKLQQSYHDIPHSQDIHPCLASPVEVGLLLLDVDGVEGVEPEPGGEGEPGLVRPLGQRRHHHRAPRLAREREEHVRPRPGDQHLILTEWRDGDMEREVVER